MATGCGEAMATVNGHAKTTPVAFVLAGSARIRDAG
jgi:hypothetical protein